MIRTGLDDLESATHDACVVGAGPVGIALALELVALGRRVLLLESGGDGADEGKQDLSDAHLADPARHDPMRIAVARRLGGTSNLWGGRCLPYDPIDFEQRATSGDARWPITFGDVAPHYERAVHYARAGAAIFQTNELAPANDAFGSGHLERWSADRKAQHAHAEALARATRVEVRLDVTVTSLTWNDDRVTHVRAVDSAGRRVSVPVRTLILATGGLESTRLLLAEQRRAPARFGGPDGALGRTYMGHVIGEIADIVFARDDLDRAFDFTIDGHGSYVRRRFTPSPNLLRDDTLLNCAFWPVVPPVADAAHGDGFLSAVALALSVDALGSRILPEAIRRRHIPVDMQRAPHLRNVARDLRSTLTDVPTLLWKRYGAGVPAPAFFKRNAAHRYGLSYHSEQSPQRASHVRLTNNTDATGLPRLSIDLRFSRDDADSVVRTHERLDSWLAQTGFGRLHYRYPPSDRRAAVLDQASHGTHQIGTARMAATPAGGIVDADLRCWGTDNLYVASSAVLPTSGQANPTLTVLALAMRLAKLLARDAAVPDLASDAASRERASAA